MEEYLLTIYVFVYLCVKFKFRYLRSNGFLVGRHRIIMYLQLDVMMKVI